MQSDKFYMLCESANEHNKSTGHQINVVQYNFDDGLKFANSLKCNDCPEEWENTFEGKLKDRMPSAIIRLLPVDKFEMSTDSARLISCYKPGVW